MKVGSQRAEMKDEHVGTAEMGDGRNHRAVGEKKKAVGHSGKKEYPRKDQSM